MSSEGEDQPVQAGRKPCYAELTVGQRILWCSCGRSAEQPFCDGASHLGTAFKPVLYRSRQDQEVLLCTCKGTATPPFCDGSHSNIPGGYCDVSLEGAGIGETLVPRDQDGISWLDGRCYVISPSDHESRQFSLQTLVSPSRGAHHQSQFYLRLMGGVSPVLTTTVGNVVLWIAGGRGKVRIGNRAFAVVGDSGVLVARSETFQLEAEEPLTVYVSVCPGCDALTEVGAMNPTFDVTQPDRVVTVDDGARKAMGPRWFQMLIDTRFGLTDTVQFIGHIPQSRAEMHRHLYEEALIIMSGEGVIWNESNRAKVVAGDVIFFPRKHVHTLQCVSTTGMDVVGLIHPGINPGINY